MSVQSTSSLVATQKSFPDSDILRDRAWWKLTKKGSPGTHVVARPFYRNNCGFITALYMKARF